MARILLLQAYGGNQAGETIEVSSEEASRLVLRLVGRVDFGRSPSAGPALGPAGPTPEDRIAVLEAANAELLRDLDERESRLNDLEARHASLGRTLANLGEKADGAEKRVAQLERDLEISCQAREAETARADALQAELDRINEDLAAAASLTAQGDAGDDYDNIPIIAPPPADPLAGQTGKTGRKGK